MPGDLIQSLKPKHTSEMTYAGSTTMFRTPDAFANLDGIVTHAVEILALTAL